ncbi:hypothetical protein [Gluconacetobacter diazotrophicus]|nr:hypothetical protein [Gluconacetobacter diazotrophicus]
MARSLSLLLIPTKQEQGMSFNLNSSWSKSDVKAMLQSVDDSFNSRIVIWKDGRVEIINTEEMETPYDDLHAYFETYQAENGYTGREAAEDDQHVSDIASTLRSNWPTLARDKYLDN